MGFPPNYRQNRQERTRAKDKKFLEKQARREERRQRKSDPAVEPPPAGEQKSDEDKE